MHVFPADHQIHAGDGQHDGKQNQRRRGGEGRIAPAVAVQHIIHIAHDGVHPGGVQIRAEEGNGVAVGFERADKPGNDHLDNVSTQNVEKTEKNRADDHCKEIFSEKAFNPLINEAPECEFLRKPHACYAVKELPAKLPSIFIPASVIYIIPKSDKMGNQRKYGRHSDPEPYPDQDLQADLFPAEAKSGKLLLTCDNYYHRYDRRKPVCYDEKDHSYSDGKKHDPLIGKACSYQTCHDSGKTDDQCYDAFLSAHNLYSNAYLLLFFS